MLFLRRSVFLLACACAGFVPIASLSRAAEAPPTPPVLPAAFAEKIAAAKQAIAEKSWARANALLTEAQALASDATLQRWAELWALDAKWRADGAPGDWQEREQWLAKIKAAYERLLAPGADLTARDEFWAEAMESRLAFAGAHDPAEFPDLRLKIADYYAAEVLTEKTVGRYCAVLRAAPSERYYGSRANQKTDLWLEHLERGGRVASSPAERADFAIQAASFAETEQLRDTKGQAALWANAVERSEGTGLAPLARVKQFLFLVRSGYAPGVAPDSSANVPERIVQARQLLAASEAADRSRASVEAWDSMNTLIDDWTRPHLLLDLPSQIAPNTPVVLRYGGEGLDRIQVTLYRHSLASWASRGADLSELSRASINDHAALAREVAALRKSGAEIVSTHEFAFTGATAKTWRTGAVKLADALTPGFYSALVESSGAPDAPTGSLHFTVTEFETTVVSVWGQPATLLVSRTSDGSPVAGKKIEGWLESVDQPWRAVLDRDGGVCLPARRAENWRNYPLAAVVEKQPVIADVSERNMRTDSLHADLIFDRPLYSPGEKVHWKLVVRERRDGRFYVARPLCALVGKTGDTVVLDETNLQPNVFGSVHGSFALPKNLRSGEVNFTLTLGNDAAGKPQKEYVRHGIRVDSFVPSAMQTRVELASAPESLRPGGEIVARIRCSYLSGGPVAGARVKCVFGVSADDHEQSTTWREWQQQLVRKPQLGVTGTDGTAEFRLRLPENWAPSGYVGVEAIVSPENAPDSVAHASWTTSRTGYVLDPGEWTDARAIRPGENVEFVARLIDGRGEPAAKRAIARLVQLAWNEAWLSPDGAVVSGDALASARENLAAEELPPPWRRLHAGYARVVVAEKPVAIDATGIVRAVFAVSKSGVFRLELALGEDEIEPAGKCDLALAVVAASDETEHLPLAPGARLFATGKGARAGSKFPVLAAVPARVGARLLIVSSESGNRVLRVEGARQVQWFEVELPSRPGPGLITLDALNGRLRPDASVRFNVDDTSRHLTVKLAPDSESSRPGASGELGIYVRNGRAEATPTEVSVAVADVAVHELAGQEGTEALTFSDYAPYLSPPEIRKPRQREVASEEQLSDSRRGSLLNPSRPPSSFEFDVIELSPFMVASERTDVGIPVVRAGAALGMGMKDLAESDEARAVIRTNFSLTAAWEPEVLTDANGEARVSFKYPDSLTRWKIVAHAIGADGNSFGSATAFTRTELPFQARVQAPRFLVAGDRAEIGGLFLNRTAQAVSAAPSFVVGGAASTAAAAIPEIAASVDVPANGEAHRTWTVEAQTAGEAEFTLTARAGQESDGMRVTVPVHADGDWQKIAASAVLTDAAPNQTLRLPLPARLDAGRARLSVSFSPGHLPALLDALPYLVDYPYGCVEQTMSRMFPALVVRDTLAKLGFSAEEVERRIALRESVTDQKRRTDTAGIADLDEVTSRSFTLLRDAQRTDGSFGWWPGAPAMDPWMTAYVVWGMSFLPEEDAEDGERIVERARTPLIGWLERAEKIDDTFAWTLAALTRQKLEEKQREVLIQHFGRAFAERDRLGSYGRACLLLAATELGVPDARAVLLRNLENGAQRATAAGYGDTVHWGSGAGYFRATDNAVECTALSLLALLAADPEHALVEPAANWLALNRRSAHWSNTRDTAFAVLALARHAARAGKETIGAAEVELLANGQSAGRVKIDRASVLGQRLALDVPPNLLRAGENEIAARLVSGHGPVYGLGLAEAWAENDVVQPAGHLASATRAFERRVARPTLAGTVRYEPAPFATSDAMHAGEEIVVHIQLTVPNDLEYVMVEVPRPAGCEPLNPLSGYDARLRRVPTDGSPATSGDSDVAIYRDEHDDRTAFFLSNVSAGVWEIRYSLRAVTPGDFRAAPVRVEAMYAPEVRANTEARRVRIAPHE